MSGPALRQLESHRDIHDGAYGDAEELTIALAGFVESGKQHAAIVTIRLLVEHWQTRTLRHAAEEEAGFYQEILAQHPQHAKDIAALTRDHDLMRQLVAEVEGMPEARDSFPYLLIRFQMLLWLAEKHSREEEKKLLDAGMQQHTGGDGYS